MVALVHGSDDEAQMSAAIASQVRRVQVWPLLTLDALVDSLAVCVGVIGVDSGLSHVAVALNLVHVQIYNFDTAWRTGPLPSPPLHGVVPASRQCSVYAAPTPSVAAVWDAWAAAVVEPAVTLAPGR